MTSLGKDTLGKDTVAAISGRRREVLDLLRQSAEPLSIAEVATRLGGHPNTARFHLEALVARGRVERVDAADGKARPGPGRPPAYFRANRQMDGDGPRNYRALAGLLVEAAAATPGWADGAALSARQWGRRLAHDRRPSGEIDSEEAVEVLVDILDDLDFAPEPHPAGVALRHCPFLEIAHQRAEVVCAIHLGLMQGVAQELDGSVEVEGLDAFLEPDLCLARLDTASERGAEPRRGGLQ